MDTIEFEETSFPINPQRLGLVIAYKNPQAVADDALFRVPVTEEKFNWLKYDLADGLTIPDTKVGRKSEPNQVEYGATVETDSVEDYGLDEVVPLKDINAAQGKFDPLARASERVMKLVTLDREVRVANLMFSLGTYSSSLRTTLSGTTQFSHPSCDPLSLILAAGDLMPMRFNKIVIGRAAYTALRTNPNIVKAYNRNSGDKGVVPKNFIEDLFEIPAGNLVVGESFMNSAKPGQAVTRVRVWGPHCALIYEDKTADNSGGVTFGFTAEYGDRVQQEFPEAKKGLRGSVRVRAGESVKEVICANELGYFFQNAAA
jgi:hypothetical protein